MRFEEKGKKAEQTGSQENKTEKEFSLSEIDELLKEKSGIFDSLDKFSKDEIFKKENFEDLRVAVDKPDDKFDEEAYAKAGFWKKFENFTRFGFQKDRYNLIKSKYGELLDKTKIDEDITGRGIEIRQNNKQEREYLEKNVIDVRGDFKKDNLERMTAKSFELVDGKIIKYVASSRTEKGQEDAAGKKREAEISRLETVNGAELGGLKESMEKNSKVRGNMSKTMELMSKEEKENVMAKLNEEDNYRKEKIQEKEYKIAEESKIFREPLEGRLNEMLGVENDLTEAFDYIKTNESDLNKKIKAYEAFIKEANKLDFLDGVGGDLVKNAEDAKAVADGKIKEFTEMKAIVSSKLEVLKNNKKEIEATLTRVNNIGKTEKEIAEEEKNKKKVEAKSDNVEEGEEDEREKNTAHKGENKETWDEVRDKAWGLTGTKGKSKSQKAGNFDELFPDYDYPVREKVNAEDEGKKGHRKDEEEIEVDENKKKEKIITDEDLRKFVEEFLNDLGLVMNRENKLIVLNLREDAYSIAEKFYNEQILSGSFKEEDIKKKIKDWYKKLPESYFKPHTETNEDKEVVEKTFTKKEIEKIVITELKVLGIMDINDKTMREQIIINVTMAVETMIKKSKGQAEEKDIKEEARDWYRKYTKNFSKKSRQPKKS